MYYISAKRICSATLTQSNCMVNGTNTPLVVGYYTLL